MDIRKEKRDRKKCVEEKERETGKRRIGQKEPVSRGRKGRKKKRERGGRERGRQEERDKREGRERERGRAPESPAEQDTTAETDDAGSLGQPGNTRRLNEPRQTY